MEPIKTSDTSLAAYLHYNGHTFMGLMKDPNDSHRRVFVFIQNDTSEELRGTYDSGTVEINPKGYYKSIRIMHKMLREGNIIE